MSPRIRTPRPVLLFSLLAAHSLSFAQMGCQDPSSEADAEDVGEAALSVHDNPKKEARRLFEEETFGGNGRTCLTCHGAETGTVSPADAQARFAADPSDPLFVHDGSDDFQGNGATRMLADATILVKLALPPGVTLADDPAATHVTVRRGIPTTLNTPALDAELMWDGRQPDLAAQALGAIQAHAQTDDVTEEQLELIAEHQQTKAFFSEKALWKYFGGGPEPKLPKGETAAQKRGRKWFEDAEVPFAINQATPRKGLCAICHSGPLLNEANGHSPLAEAPFPTPPDATRCDAPAQTGARVPKGTRYQSVLVSELNAANNPVHLFEVQTPGGPVTIPSPDPGRALTTGNFAAFPTPGGEFSNFKIPILWGVKKTAPYFHDNSAKTLEEVVNHYQTFFIIATDCNIDGDPPLVMTEQDKADLVAYLKLL